MVASEMRTRYDQFGKQMVRAALEERGTIETDAEVTADTRRIDILFMPNAADRQPADHLGLLGRIASKPSTLEMFHNTPEGIDLVACRAPPDAPERMLASPILVRLRLTVPSDPDKQTPDDKEFLMDTQDIVENFRREAVREGLQQGVRKSLFTVYNARFGTMPADLRQIVESIEDEPTLSSWLQLACSRDVGEVTAAIRASQVS